jgi:hypothetical protein
MKALRMVGGSWFDPGLMANAAQLAFLSTKSWAQRLPALWALFLQIIQIFSFGIPSVCPCISARIPDNPVQ